MATRPSRSTHATQKPRRHSHVVYVTAAEVSDPHLLKTAKAQKQNMYLIKVAIVHY